MYMEKNREKNKLSEADFYQERGAKILSLQSASAVLETDAADSFCLTSRKMHGTCPLVSKKTLEHLR